MVAAGEPVFYREMVIGIDLKAQILANTMERQLTWFDVCTKQNNISVHIAKIIDDVLAIADLE